MSFIIIFTVGLVGAWIGSYIAYLKQSIKWLEDFIERKNELISNLDKELVKTKKRNNE